MGRFAVTAFALVLLATTSAPAQVTQVHLTYDTYAAGLQVMQMHAFFGLGPWNYQVNLDYHTTGLVGLLYGGRQVNTVRGIWQDNQASPAEFYGEGVWRGHPRRTLIDYDHGLPEVRELQPPQDSEREQIPQELRLHTMDTLSALAQLIRQVADAHNCDTEVHTYDGRRVLELTARTHGTETLAPTGRSIFSGPTLRCDFEGRELAGFLIGENDKEHRQPLHGSAWLAPMMPETPSLPVRIAFETRWFGMATMYLTRATPGGPE
jgi:opacity protein-like surface antigen